MRNESQTLPPYTVLMSVYNKENPSYLQESIHSMMTQTVLPSDFVLVEDGVLGDKLKEAVDSWKQNYPQIFQIVKLETNVGTGKALNAGLEFCKHEIIVKMDSDDISLSNRCEKLIKAMQQNKSVSVVGSYVEEFEDVTNEFIAVKKVPLTDSDIRAFAKRRSPFNNQSVAYKKSEAIKIGGYSNLRRCEDYDFFVRLLMNGCEGMNLPQVLVRYRVNHNNYKKRSNLKNTRDFIKVRYKIYRSGFSSLWDFIITSSAQILLLLMPNVLVGWIYKKFLRK